MSKNPYAPPTDLALERTTLNGPLLSTVGYGVLLTLAVETLLRLLQRPRAHIRWPLVALTFALLAPASIAVAGDARFSQLTFIDARDYPGGPSAVVRELAAHWANVMSVVSSLVMGWLANGFLLWRFLTVYNTRRALAVPPALLFAGTVATSLAALASLLHPHPHPHPRGPDPSTARLALASHALALALSAALTLGIAASFSSTTSSSSPSSSSSSPSSSHASLPSTSFTIPAPTPPSSASSSTRSPTPAELTHFTPAPTRTRTRTRNTRFTFSSSARAPSAPAPITHPTPSPAAPPRPPRTPLARVMASGAVLTLLAESGALQTAWGAALLAALVAHAPARALLGPVWCQVQGISALLILLRIAHAPAHVSSPSAATATARALSFSAARPGRPGRPVSVSGRPGSVSLPVSLPAPVHPRLQDGDRGEDMGEEEREKQRDGAAASVHGAREAQKQRDKEREKEREREREKHKEGESKRRARDGAVACRALV
ncbi:hypothetical protein B0H15DRAFT_932757 [Mycena belliarum]|uniref:Uncharacterized protein n=1 Tax=Mycena belliarum TaxID=1033014 RepID=A0AAD6XR73_9AGAR|nr:hypothetical protein B0H15DRAFT_932757 [Mycena belliae]